MPSATERRRNNLRTGVFVSVAMLITIGVIMQLGGIWKRFETMDQYTVQFSVRSGVKNIKPGGEVRVGGVALGQVTAVRPQFEGETPYETVLVDFELKQDVELFDDAVITVKKPLIGAGAWLEITSVGSGGADHPRATAPILAVSTAGTLEDFVGPDIAQNLSSGMDFFGDIRNLYETDVKPTVDDVKELTARVRGEDWPRWASQVDEVMTWATGFTNTVNDAIAEGHGMLSDGRALIADNRPNLDLAIANVKDASEDVKAITTRVQEESMAQVQRLLETGQSAMDDVVAAVDRVRADYEPWAEDFGETLGSANLASQQMKFALIEVRRSPWKLLYRPSADELEHELLYEAARSFALAVADVKAASASMQRVLADHGDALRADPELFEKVKRNLVEPLDRYEQAQNRLFEVLIEEK